MRTPKLRSRVVVGAALALAAAGLTVGAALATDEARTTELAAEADTMTAGEPDGNPVLAEQSGAGECVSDSYQPTADELEAANAEVNTLADVLTAAGIANTVVADRSGFVEVEYDYGSAIAGAVVNSFFEGLYPPEPLSEEEIEAMRRENDALLTALQEAGVAAELVVGDAGYEWVEWPDADAAARTAVDAVYETFYTAEELDPADPEIVESIKLENDALAAFLDDARIAYTRSADESGYGWVEWDEEDRSSSAAVDGFYEELYPPEPITDDEREVLKAENDALAAALDEAGVDYQRSTDQWGYESIDWDYEDPAADAAAMEFFNDRYGSDDCFEGLGQWVPTDEELASNNSEIESMAAYFDGAGIAYSVVADEYGFRSLDWDYDDEAANAVADEYWDDQEVEWLARVNVELESLTAALDEAGISYRTGCNGQCHTLVFDTSDPAALAVVAALS